MAPSLVGLVALPVAAVLRRTQSSELRVPSDCPQAEDPAVANYFSKDLRMDLNKTKKDRVLELGGLIERVGRLQDTSEDESRYNKTYTTKQRKDARFEALKLFEVNTLADVEIPSDFELWSKVERMLWDLADEPTGVYRLHLAQLLNASKFESYWIGTEMESLAGASFTRKGVQEFNFSGEGGRLLNQTIKSGGIDLDAHINASTTKEDALYKAFRDLEHRLETNLTQDVKDEALNTLHALFVRSTHSSRRSGGTPLRMLDVLDHFHLGCIFTQLHKVVDGMADKTGVRSGRHHSVEFGRYMETEHVLAKNVDISKELALEAQQMHRVLVGGGGRSGLYLGGGTSDDLDKYGMVLNVVGYPTKMYANLSDLPRGVTADEAQKMYSNITNRANVVHFNMLPHFLGYGVQKEVDLGETNVTFGGVQWQATVKTVLKGIQLSNMMPASNVGIQLHPFTRNDDLRYRDTSYYAPPLGSSQLDAVFQEMTRNLDEGKDVLVQGDRGSNRGAFYAVAYLMWRHKNGKSGGMPFEEAVEHVQWARPATNMCHLGLMLLSACEPIGFQHCAGGGVRKTINVHYRSNDGGLYKHLEFGGPFVVDFQIPKWFDEAAQDRLMTKLESIRTAINYYYPSVANSVELKSWEYDHFQVGINRTFSLMKKVSALPRFVESAFETYWSDKSVQRK